MNLKKETKLLFVISALEAGGAEKSLVNLLNLIDYDRYQVDLLLFKNQGIFAKQIPSTVNVIEIPDDLFYLYNFRGRGIKRAIGAFLSILARIAGTVYRNYIVRDRSYPGTQIRWNKFYKNRIAVLDTEYDVAVSYMHGEVMYYVAEKIKAKNKITWVHNDYRATRLKPQLDLPYFSMFDHIVTISKECVDIFVKVFPQFKNKTVCIPNLTSSELVRRLSESFYPPEYKECNINEKKIILSIGRLNHQKGFDIAIEIAADLKKKNTLFTWFIIGQGEEREKLVELARQYKVENEVIFLGVRENPYPYIKYADVIAQPSRFEGKSVVIDEAKIIGKPIVVSNYATVGDQIIQDIEGIVVPLDAKVFAGALYKVMTNADIREELSRNLLSHEYGNANEIDEYYTVFSR